MVQKQLITGPNFKQGLGGRVWSPGLKVGPWVFLSGVTAMDYKTMKTVGATGGTSTTPPKIDPSRNGGKSSATSRNWLKPQAERWRTS